MPTVVPCSDGSAGFAAAFARPGGVPSSPFPEASLALDASDSRQNPAPPGAPQPTSRARSVLISLAVGGSAGAVGKTMIAPLDRVKIIFQISKIPFSFHGVKAELVRTYTHDGFAALFRGNWAQVVRVFPYSGIKLVSFDVFSELAMRLRSDGGRGGAAIGEVGKSTLTSTERLFAGAGAGAASVLLTYPLDVFRARLAVQRESDSSAQATLRSRGLLRAIWDSGRSDGVRSLFRGIWPTLAGILPYAAISFALFEELKEASRKLTGGQEPGVSMRVACGGLAGLVGQGATYPLDIVRRRMQTEGFSAIHAYAAAPSAAAPPATDPAPAAAARPPLPSTWATLVHVARAEGVRGLWKGFSLNFFKGPVAVGTSFAAYDWLKGAFGVSRAAGVE